MSIQIQAEYQFEAVREAVPELVDKAMEICGQTAERYAKELCPKATGNLQNSITHNVASYFSFATAYVGTNVGYAPYVEMGTGAFVAGGSPPWVYTPDGGQTFYRTVGQQPRPFIKPSIANHTGEYSDIIEKTLKG